MAQHQNPHEVSSSDCIAGRQAVREALKSDMAVDAILVDRGGGGLGDIIRAAGKRGIPVKYVPGEKLSQLAGGVPHQGVVAQAAGAAYVPLEILLAGAREKGEQPLLVLCDGILDPHNLGAIIRTAEAAGAHGIVVPKRRTAPLGATVAKTSAGAVSYLPVGRVSNLAAAIEELKHAGVWVYGTDMEGLDYTKADFTAPTALVIGSEGSGLSRLVREKCDQVVSLPMRGRINSLNASVAAGIFLYEAVRQRRLLEATGDALSPGGGGL